MTMYTTYIARPLMSYMQPGYQDALSAAAEINTKLGNSGESSFIIGDELADRTAERAMQREIDSCHPEIRASLMIDKFTGKIDD